MEKLLNNETLYLILEYLLVFSGKVKETLCSNYAYIEIDMLLLNQNHVHNIHVYKNNLWHTHQLYL